MPTPAPATTVAGASGGGTTAPAAAVGVGDMSSLLRQLSDAVALLGTALAGMHGSAGGGPMQVPIGFPTQLPPGVPIQSGGGTGSTNPHTLIRGRLDRLESNSALSAPTKVALATIRTELATLDAKRIQTGSSNQGATLRLNASIDAALLPPNDPRLPQLNQFIAEVRVLEAKAETTGSFNQVEIQRLTMAHEAVMRKGPPSLA